MITQLKNTLSSPIFESEQKTYKADVLNTILLTSFGLTVIATISTLLTDEDAASSMLFFGAFAIIEIVAYIFMRVGWVTLSGVIFSITIWGSMNLAAYFFGGVRGASYSANLVVVLIVGLILGSRGVFIFVGLSIVSGFILLQIENSGLLPPDSHSLTPSNAWISQTMVFALGALLLRMATHNLSTALQSARQNEKALTHSNHQLQKEVGERRRAEEELRQSEEKYSKLFRHSNDGILLANLSLKIVDANQKVLELLTYSREDILALKISDLYSPEVSLSLEEFWQQLMKNGVAHVETHCRKRDDVYFPAELSASLVEIGGKRVIQAIVRDITLRLQAEAAWQAANDELEHRVQERTAELAAANEQLEQFAYVASHDLRAPLRGISSLAMWIEEDLEDVLKDETREYMNLLHRRIHRMEALIEGILEYSRLDSAETQLERVDVTELLNEVIDLLNPPPTLSVKVGNAMPILMTERIKLGQVFSNLIGNAIKYHDKLNGYIHITVQHNGQFYEFEVADNGPGIAPEYHQKIFGIFETLQARDQVESSGVGLALVKKIVEMEGGRISVQSDEGEGARFRFTWPVSQNDVS